MMFDAGQRCFSSFSGAHSLHYTSSPAPNRSKRVVVSGRGLLLASSKEQDKCQSDLCPSNFNETGEVHALRPKLTKLRVAQDFTGASVGLLKVKGLAGAP